MKSVRIAGDEKIEIIDVPEPAPEPGQVVVQTAVSALCGSELGAYRKGGRPKGNSGHEGAGVVVALGEGVSAPVVGTRVGVSAVSGCGECEHCRAGRYTWCENKVGCGSMHAEKFVAPSRACQVLPDDLPWDVGAMISGDGMGVPYHTSTKLPPAVETVAVLGLGPVGLGSTLLQTHLGRRVIGVDVSPPRLTLARELGAVETIDAGERDDVVAAIRERTGGKGPDVCIEAAGRPETAKQCFAAVRTGGMVVFNGEQGAVELSPSEDFIRRDITAVGAWFYHFCEFAAMLELYRGGLAVEKLITHRYPLDQADEAYRRFAAAETGKVVLEIAPNL